MKDDTLIVYFNDCFKVLIDPLDDLKDKFISFEGPVSKRDMDIFNFLHSLHLKKEISKKCRWNREWKDKISSINNWVFFVRMLSDDEKKVSQYIIKKNPKAKIFFFSWDIDFAIDNKTFKTGVCGTFDENYAKANNIECWGQFANEKLFKKVMEKKVDVEYDYMFIGQDKGRKEIVYSIDEELKKVGLKGMVLIGAGFAVSYLEYLDYLMKSKCVMDITQKNQSGITLRVMESIFFGKKIISNNKALRNYDFYNPNNMFILGENNLEDTTGRTISEFMQAPYVEVSEEIKNRYSFENFIDRIIQEK